MILIFTKHDLKTPRPIKEVSRRLFQVEKDQPAIYVSGNQFKVLGKPDVYPIRKLGAVVSGAGKGPT